MNIILKTIIKTLKNIIKKILPESLINWINLKQIKFELYQLYWSDLIRFKQNAFGLNSNNDRDNLEARMTFFYHAIEKGLSNPHFREGFGKKAINSLFVALREFDSKSYSRESLRYLTALSVLREYCNIHANRPDITEKIYDELNAFSVPDKSYGGVVHYKKEDFIKNIKGDFLSIVQNRKSVRDYSDEKVDLNIVLEAIEIALKSPSVCNRQSWIVHLITSAIKIEKILEIQGGLTGNGENLANLILITVNNKCFLNAKERNQGYIDGGIFGMSLIYALTYKGLATCALNANLDMKREAILREFLNIGSKESLIMFISLGYYPSEFACPKSYRDSIKDKVKFH